MPQKQLSFVLLAGFVGWCGAAALASPISAIQFPNGKVLNVLGTVGTGPDTAYLAVDFSNTTPAGPAYAWQYNYTSGTATEADLMTAIAAADTNLSVLWDPNYPYPSRFLDNFNYASNVGAASPWLSDGWSYWASSVGSYDSTDSTNAATQNINWVYAYYGADGLILGDLYDDSGTILNTGVEGLIYGWTIKGEYQTDNLTPNLPETSTAVPEPGTFSLLALAGLGLATRRRRS